ncbi:TetR/AcrR family transcriptional regulator [Rhodococcus sp. B50]|uniref:TetR/AcrR family transcriptional regulator n=1 Tax=Rhodococcus sp. B50 TaxID=2682847 RepID=UPI0019E5C714|nr:TetR/AcrR family transcriptional regulator [Rhodococcus sp. B50]MBS9375208.1 HTH-type transcriptional repressor KstR2 [Rhodococcus sp. B50]
MGESKSGPPDRGREPARLQTEVATGRENILNSAVENFQRLGYHGTSVRDIARDAGITPASIYHHFASKQIILQEIMEKVLGDVISLTRAAVLRAGETPVSQLEALVRTWVLFHTSRRAEALIGASEIRSLDDVGHRLVITLRDHQEQLFHEVIDRGVADGSFTTPYPREAARAIINMGYSIASWYRPGGELSPDELADRYAALALGTAGADLADTTPASHPLSRPTPYPTPTAERPNT